MIWNNRASKVHSKKYRVLWQECGKRSTNTDRTNTVRKYGTQFRISDLLVWTTMVAILCASYTLAPLIDPPNFRLCRTILLTCMIASVPFAFIVSLIRQPITSSRMWASFLFAVLVSGWVGCLAAEIPIKNGYFPGMSALIAVGMGMILSMVSSIVVPCFIASLRYT